MDPLTLGTGFLFGLRHSLEPDHVTALAHFASSDPRPRRGAAFGLRWGLGHALAVVALGGLLLPLGLHLGGRFERAAEVAVGVTLVALALWRLLSLALRKHDHVHRHDGLVHSHPHRHGLGHLHAHAPTLTGVVHGTSGVIGVLALLPLSPSLSGRILTLVAFSLGSLLSMGLLGLLAGRLYAHAARWHRLATLLTAVVGLSLGAVWIARNI
jgi:sulfite exporter TauE/SafE